jgi:hypothetical protein
VLCAREAIGTAGFLKPSAPPVYTTKRLWYRLQIEAEYQNERIIFISYGCI